MLISACVPGHGLCGVARDRLVHGDGVKLFVGCASRHDVHGCGGCKERSVVPGEGYKVSDFVVLSTGNDGGV